MLFQSFRDNEQKATRVEGARVFLRPALKSDFKAWVKLRETSRDFLVPWEPTWPPDALSSAAFRRRLRVNAEEWQQATGFSFLVFRTGDNELLGGITLSNVRRGVAQSGSLGYWIGEPHARQGYMSDALQAALGFAFETLALHRIEAACLNDNAASQALLRKSGFKEAGYARQYLRINGKWQDHLLFEILRSDPRGFG